MEEIRKEPETKKDMTLKEIVEAIQKSTEPKKDYADQHTVNLLFQSLADKFKLDESDLSAQAECRVYHCSGKLNDMEIKQRTKDYICGGRYIAKKYGLC